MKEILTNIAPTDLKRFLYENYDFQLTLIGLQSTPQHQNYYYLCEGHLTGSLLYKDQLRIYADSSIETHNRPRHVSKEMIELLLSSCPTQAEQKRLYSIIMANSKEEGAMEPMNKISPNKTRQHQIMDIFNEVYHNLNGSSKK